MPDGTAGTSVTGVIAPFNTGFHTLESLARLTKQQLTGPFAIVVDNASSHDSADTTGKVFPGTGVIRLSGNLRL
jgi:GT2 family glycosyltransferase